MSLTPVKTPKIVELALPQLHWSIPNSDKEIYLTFDDGPTPIITDWVLDTLYKFNAKATFFCIGKNVESHPEIFERIIKNGHGIGNHSYSHIKGWKSKTKGYLEDISKASRIIDSNLFRPPYGRIKPNQIKGLREQNYQIIMWSILSVDWNKNISPEQCLENVISKSKPGDIIVFHDSKKAANNMQYALPKVLEYFSDRNYTFKRIPELSQ